MGNSIDEWVCRFDLRSPAPPPTPLGLGEAYRYPVLPQLQLLCGINVFDEQVCVRDPSGLVLGEKCSVHVDSFIDHVPLCPWRPRIAVKIHPPAVKWKRVSGKLHVVPTRSIALHDGLLYRTEGMQWLREPVGPAPHRGEWRGISVSCSAPRLTSYGGVLLVECGSGHIVLRHGWAAYRVEVAAWMGLNAILNVYPGKRVEARSYASTLHLGERVGVVIPGISRIIYSPGEIHVYSRVALLYSVDDVAVDPYTAYLSITTPPLSATGAPGMILLRYYPPWIRVLDMYMDDEVLDMFLINPRGDTVRVELNSLLGHRFLRVHDAWSPEGYMVEPSGAAFSFIMRPYSITRIVYGYEKPPSVQLLHRYLWGLRAGVWR